MRTLVEALEQRVLLADGSVARYLHASKLNEVRDFHGTPRVLPILNLSRPEVVRRSHEAFIAAGADVVRTNSLGASPLSLAQFGFADEAFYLNHAAAELACAAVDNLPGKGRRRFVLGIVRDEGWDVAPAEIEAAVAIQVEGLLSGGVDGVTLDIMPGTGRTPIFLRAAQRAKENLGAKAPVFLQRGHAGPDFSDLARSRAEGVIRYRHGSLERSDWLRQTIEEGRVNLIGGGDGPADTERLDALIRQYAEDGFRPYPPAARPEAVDEATIPSSLRSADLAPSEVN